jgi:AmmeMemoRadiSam system protein B
MTDAPNNPPLPPLRGTLEAIEIEHEGQPLILLRDLEGINADPMAIPVPAFLIATMLNGRTTAAEIQTVFSKTTGTMISLVEVETLVGELEKANLLETPALKLKREKILKDFTDSPIRPATMLKTGYPEQPLEIAAFLGKFFKDAKGPGVETVSTPTKPRPPFMLVAPHIDLHRGGPAYAWAYQALSNYPIPDTIIALGVAHMSPNSPWVMTRKTYETPYGPMAVDNKLADDIQKSLWYAGTTDEWTHRQEHSLEFQALWLKYLWRDKAPSWVPILCSSFDRFAPEQPPSTVETVEKAIRDIGAMLQKRVRMGEKIMILAGVDLAHVGPRFGDQIILGPDTEQRVEKEDRASLDEALKLNADKFYTSVVADGHWRKVCGLSALYTGLRLLKIMTDGAAAPQARLLTYGQAPDPAGGLVSFTSMIYE